MKSVEVSFDLILARARAAERDLAQIARRRRPSKAELARAHDAYAAAAQAIKRRGGIKRHRVQAPKQGDTQAAQALKRRRLVKQDAAQAIKTRSRR